MSKSTKIDENVEGRKNFENINSTKPLQNHFQKYNSEPGEIVFEVEVDESFELDPGAVVKVSDVFEVGQKVDISGISKGKGFAGE